MFKKEDSVDFHYTIFRTSLLVGVAMIAIACIPEEEPDICSQYCDAEELCQEASAQMFSRTECRYECDVAMERHDSVGCGEQMQELFECLVDLPCAQWGDYGDRCAAEIDYLDICVGGSS